QNSFVSGGGDYGKIEVFADEGSILIGDNSLFEMHGFGDILISSGGFTTLGDNVSATVHGKGIAGVAGYDGVTLGENNRLIVEGDGEAGIISRNGRVTVGKYTEIGVE